MAKDFELALLGFAIGDALGVPYEFQPQGSFHATDMIGYGTYNQPAGTWSDDTSMTLAVADAMIGGYSEDKVIKNFQDWLFEGKFTTDGKVFDVGNTCNAAIARMYRNEKPYGESGEYSNGNGSLMRMIPFVFYCKDMTEAEWKSLVDNNSALTHAHDLSLRCCEAYVESGLKLLQDDKTLEEVYQEMLEDGTYDDLIKFDFNKVKSSGYVVDSLQFALFCLLTTENYKDAVLKAVNLGSDTDTVGAITGGLAGLYYGKQAIPEAWLNQLLNKNELEELISKFN